MKKSICILLALLVATVLISLAGMSLAQDQKAAPKAEAPKADAPKAEAPKAEAPKADAPKADAPKVAPKAKGEVKKAKKVVKTFVVEHQSSVQIEPTPKGPKWYVWIQKDKVTEYDDGSTSSYIMSDTRKYVKPY